MTGQTHEPPVPRDGTPRLRWTHPVVLTTIAERRSLGKPLRYSAMIADNESLLGGARRLFELLTSGHC